MIKFKPYTTDKINQESGYIDLNNEKIKYKITKESNYSELSRSFIEPLYLIQDLLSGYTIPEWTDYTLAVTVAGSNPIYKWYKDNIIIYEATGSSYTIISASTSAEGYYKVEINNKISNLSSIDSFIEIQTAFEYVYFIREPISGATIKLGESIYIDAEVDGDINYYEWLEDGIPIPDTNLSGITISGTETGSTLYYIYVNGFANSILSSGTTIVVEDTIDFNPQYISTTTLPSLADCRDIHWDPTGYKVYIRNGSFLYQYSVTTPYTLNGISLISSINFLSYSATINNTRGIYIEPSGNYFYVGDLNTDYIYRFLMPTPWLITGALQAGSLYIGDKEGGYRGMYMNPEGTKLLMVGVQLEKVNQYSLSTPFLLSSASFDRDFTLPQAALDPQSIDVESDTWGRDLFVVTGALSGGTQRILRYKIDKFNIKSNQLVYNYSISSSLTTTARGMSFIKNTNTFVLYDATKVYFYNY
jgi:hypothetical protein